MRVVACQIDVAWEDRRANHAKARALVGRAAPGPEALIVLPEMFATGFSMNVAETCGPGAQETEGFVRGLAAEHSCAVAAGVTTRGERGECYNEMLVASASAGGVTELARYRKMHLFSPAGEHEHYAPGRADLAVVPTAPGRADPAVVPTAPGEARALFRHLGFLAAPFICYDLRFPEGFRTAARTGADLFVVIANWPTSRVSHWEVLLRARAIENQAFVVGVNRTGADPENDYPGRSMIVGPAGEVLAEAGPEECVVSAELDPAVVRDSRRSFPAVRDAGGRS
jgi:predicted amidohydrolase